MRGAAAHHICTFDAASAALHALLLSAQTGNAGTLLAIETCDASGWVHD